MSAIPTGLPAVVTAILSRGTTTLASAGAIVKRLRSVETLGSTSAINSDKTGTLTLNQMTAVQMAVVHGRYAITGEGYSTEGQITHVGGQVEGPLDSLLLPMALCADAEIRDGGAGRRPDRGRARRPRGEGRGRPDPHPRALPARRDPPVRRRLQVHGDVPPDDRRQRARRSSAPTSRGRRTSSSRVRSRRRAPTASSTRSTRSASRTSPRTTGWAPRACGSWRPRSGTSTRRRSIRTPTCFRSSPTFGCWRSSASSTRRGSRHVTPSPRRTRPASRCG